MSSLEHHESTVDNDCEGGGGTYSFSTGPMYLVALPIRHHGIVCMGPTCHLSSLYSLYSQIMFFPAQLQPLLHIQLPAVFQSWMSFCLLSMSASPTLLLVVLSRSLALIKKKTKFSSCIRKSRVEQLQSHIWLTAASSYITKYWHISSYTVLGSPSSYLTLQPLPYEFPYI
jgi:hypothetical protein